MKNQEGIYNRLRVFAACKNLMDLHDRQPQPYEVYDLVPGISEHTVRTHMKELNGAAGLEHPTWPPLQGGKANMHSGDWDRSSINIAGSLPVDSFFESNTL